MSSQPLQGNSPLYPKDSSAKQSTIQSRPSTAPRATARIWTGRALTALAGLFMIFDGVMKLFMPAPVVEGSTRLGFPLGITPGVGVLLLLCTLVYLIPRTAVLGAVLLTGYLGGAVAIQMRAGSPPFENVFPVLFAIVVWAGIYLRDDRLRSLVPLRCLRG